MINNFQCSHYIMLHYYKIQTDLFVIYEISAFVICLAVLSSSVLLSVCNSSIAFTEDDLPTQEPAVRAVAERPATQPAQHSSGHDGPGLLCHCESALLSPLLL